MQRFYLLFLIGFSYLGFAQGFEQNRIENYLYGPFFNDPQITVNETIDVKSYFKGKRCNTKALIRIYNDFFSPGLWEKETTIKAQENVTICAWNGQSKARALMDKMVYAHYLKQSATTENAFIRDIIYDPEFIVKVTQKSPEILRTIPDSHPNYLSIALATIEKYPSAFNDVTMRFKRHPNITQLLFKIKPSYDDIYKHMAIQYALDETERKAYIMHNGLLYLELPIEKRNNPYLAYHAFVQNDIIYRFIPPSILDVFNADGPIMVPRYMTRVIMLRQKVGRNLGAIFAPIRDAFRGTEALDDVSINVANDSETEQEKTTAEDATGKNKDVTFETIDFTNEQTVVTDIRIINKIEMKKKRRLLNLWRISRFGDNGQVYVAMFRPDGKDNLGTIVIKQNERIMFSDYAAVFSMDGESIWRVQDDGTFSAKSFVLNKVKKSSEGYLNFSFSWKGKYTTNQFNLVDQSGLLIKEFINYYFE